MNAINAARAFPDSNGPEHVSDAEQRRRAQASRRLKPTIYEYVVPQDSSTLCSLCQILDDNEQPQIWFAGHDVNQAAHRHLLCMHHYQGNRDNQWGCPCPTCRGIIDIWRNAKHVQIAADGTETVIRQGELPRPRGGKRNHTHGRKRRHNRKRVTRRR